MKTLQTAHSQRGALLIEVLITIVVVAIGALGLIQMQTRLQTSEMEAYQRTQAVILLNDMTHRISANRGNAASYVTTALDTPYLGGTTTDLNCSTISTADLQGSDFAQWCNALQGAAEIQSGSGVGAMLGGRGCVQAVGATQYMVTVVWQGLTPVSAPPAGVTCGADLYSVPGRDCGDTGELCRRYVTSIVSLARLDL
jgi:type IV pilus assembly protein PilV